ncbi:MAG: hypothetical protein WCI57_04545 [Candidatus Berkelbacteria bacterium]
MKISHVLVLLIVVSLGLYLVIRATFKSKPPDSAPPLKAKVSYKRAKPKPAKSVYAMTTYYLRTGHRTATGKVPTTKLAASNSREKLPYKMKVKAVEYYDKEAKQLFTIPAKEQKELTLTIEDSTGAAHVREASNPSRYWKIASRHGTKKIRQLRIDIFAGSHPSPVVKKYSGKILHWIDVTHSHAK